MIKPCWCGRPTCGHPAATASSPGDDRQPEAPRLFVLQRDVDATGVSGVGPVADGVQWPDGSVVLRWRERPSTSVWASLDLMLSVHGHDGATRVVWADEAAAVRREALANIAAAFDVPAAVMGTEAALAILNRQITDAIQSVQDGQAAPIEVGDERIVEAVMPFIEELLAARDRAQQVYGRAYQLADRWEAAHESAYFLVRAAGAELRDVLDTARDELDGTAAGDCERPDQAAEPETTARVLSALHRSAEETVTRVIDLYERWKQAGPCSPIGISMSRYLRWWDERLIELHHAIQPPMDPVYILGVEAPAERGCSNPDHACGTCGDCVYQHPGEGDCPDDSQAPPNQGPLTGIEVRDPCPYCEDCRLIPRVLMADHIRKHHPDVTLASHENGTNDRQACPYCPGATLFLRRELARHVENQHARVLTALASGVSLDEVLHDAAVGRQLPHETEA